MKSFGTYISKHLRSFAVMIVLMFVINIILFAVAFSGILNDEYRENSPRRVLAATAEVASSKGVSEAAAQILKQGQIWAMFIGEDGHCTWTLDLPGEVPEQYTLQDVALFAKGYIADYPVFVWNMDDGLLVLGYPKDSYTKLTSNYYSARVIEMLPEFIFGMLVIDVLLLFIAYYFSKRSILKNTEPIITAIDALSAGKPISLQITGELADVANGVNKTSQVISRQNAARANWISGVSHDIRTPLSMIMGYADRICADNTASERVKEQAEIVRKQSVKIRDLVQDLNLVSQMEYDMQPLHKEPARLAKLLRTYVADLLNTGIPEAYIIDLSISAQGEAALLECDSRLIVRAVNNLVQNSIQHNPRGCRIEIILDYRDDAVFLSVKDNGCGFSKEKLYELKNKPHYIESTDDRLALRHGLGLLIVQQITAAHGGNLVIKNGEDHGCQIDMAFRTSSPTDNQALL